MKPGAMPHERSKEDLIKIYQKIDAIVNNPSAGEAALDSYRDELPGYNQWKQEKHGVVKSSGAPVLFSSQLPSSDIPVSPALSPGKFHALKEQADRKAAEREAAQQENGKKRCCNLL